MGGNTFTQETAIQDKNILQFFCFVLKWIRLLPSATKLRRLCFYTCLSVILFTGVGGVPGQVAPPAGTPPSRYAPQQVPPWAGTPPRQVHPPDRYTPRQVHPPAGTPPRSRYIPPGRYTPPPTPRQTATVADGTHPTGKHSCFVLIFGDVLTAIKN